MQPEIEAKFLSISIDDVRARLQAADAVCEQPLRLMRRVSIEVPKHIHPDAFVRIRDEGYRTAVTYKQFDSLTLHGVKEIELVVDNYERAIELFAAVGLPQRSFQESRRENWRLAIDDTEVEVMIDEWPWLKPYIEIEGKYEAAVRRAAEKLGFAWEKAVFGDVMAAYRAEYPHLTEKDTVGHIASVRFDDPLPELLIPKAPKAVQSDTMITYYTDGSASPNPGPGGYAVIRDMKPVALGSEPGGTATTNIRMEGFAIMAALKDADGQPCEIYTDSEFWINVITKWSLGWEKNGWKKKGGEIKNLDIVQEVCPLFRRSRATLIWVRGHNNDPGNELADHWANEARKQHLGKK